MKAKFGWAAIVLILFALAVVVVRHRGKLEQAYFWVQLRQLNKQVLALEKAGQNTVVPRQILTETEWLVDSTRDFKRNRPGAAGAARHLERTPQAERSRRTVGNRWQLGERLYGMVLQAGCVVRRDIRAQTTKARSPNYPVTFLDQINSPEKLTAHLNTASAHLDLDA